MIQVLIFISLLYSSFAIFAVESSNHDTLVVIEKEDDLFLVGKQTLFLEDKENYLNIDDILKIENQKKFQLNDGEIFAFIGHNGAGKTTTIKSIVGILDFEQGDILINKKSIKKQPIEKQKEYIEWKSNLIKPFLSNIGVQKFDNHGFAGYRFKTKTFRYFTKCFITFF